MISTDRIRRRADEERLKFGFALDKPVRSDVITRTIAAAVGLEIVTLDPDDMLLGGAQAVLDVDLGVIYQRSDRSEDVRCYDVAHELAHWFLHSQNCECNDSDLGTDSAELATLAEAVVDGYSPHERRESEANQFAAELLMPLPLAFTCFSERSWNGQKISCEVRVPLSVVRRQLTDAVLLPLPTETTTVLTTSTPLDSSQAAAAFVERGPLLVSAGPGTGKTKTLVGRCIHLTKTKGVRPDSILALTYSRKAAAEMHERLLAAGVGGERSGPWIGTFHSFGIEILRKYGDKIGLNDDLRLVDQLDAVTLLENNLPSLELDHLRNVRNPAQHLAGILNKIGRAKDELRSPEVYSELAARELSEAQQKSDAFQRSVGKKLKKDADKIDEQLRKASRVVEVARAYKIYEQLLREFNLVDYGDLIVKAVELLEAFPEVRSALNHRYPHVLADEYQDVNRASARLLKLLAGDDACGLWVVGDHRQSIYQFQGASPANVSQFHNEYSNGQLYELAVNYRSVQQIVDTFSLAARKMSFSKTVTTDDRWIAFRGPSSGSDAALLSTSESSDDQYKLIATRMRLLERDGIKLSDQAVLCRTHRQAREASDALTKHGIPSLYIGQLLERPEIKNLIAILTLCSGGDSASFVRAAAMPEYGVAKSTALRWLAATDLAGTRLLDRLTDVVPLVGTAVCEAGGIETLRSHLVALQDYFYKPSSLITSYIFNLSNYLEMLKNSETGDSFSLVQAKIAVRQFIELIEGFEHRTLILKGEESLGIIPRLLAYLRRVAAVGTPSSLPDNAVLNNLDAVRVATVHSAKGLEFSAVYLPNLNAGDFPSHSRQDGIPDVSGLSAVVNEEADEEECLFFVGLSRAKDKLFLSHYGFKGSGQAVAPSPLLATLSDAIAEGVLQEIDETTNASALPNELEDTLPSTLDTLLPLFTASELESYERCPKQYYYERIEKLQGSDAEDGYRKFHSVVNGFADWLEEATRHGACPVTEARLEALEALWATYGPVGHTHESLFHAEAVKVALAEWPSSNGKPATLSMTAKLSNALVEVRPDKTCLSGEKLTMSRRIIGEPGDDDHTNKILALYRKAAKDTYRHFEPLVELHYVSTGSTMEVADSRWETKRLVKYEQAAEGILQEQFPAKPSQAAACSSCPFLFVCPRSEDNSQ